MLIKDVFDPVTTAEIAGRIQRLNPDLKPLWGTMTAAQMLAHCNVTYEMVYEEDKHAKPNPFLKFILKLLVKNTVVNDKPYKRSSKTAPAFLIRDERDFAGEKERLIAYINKAQQSGAHHFDGKESHSFGVLTAAEWNNLFYKHLDHHLRQFGV